MYLKQNFASKGPGNRGPVQKAMGQSYFCNFFFHVFLAEFGKAYIISIEIKHGM